jgi:hypothetical protein
MSPAFGAKEAQRAVGYERRLLVHDEAPGPWNELELECVGSGGLLANGSGRNKRVPLSDEEQRGHSEGRSGVASGKTGTGLTQPKAPVEQLARAGPPAFEAIGEGFDLALRECIGPRAQREPRQTMSHRPSPQRREGQAIW